MDKKFFDEMVLINYLLIIRRIGMGGCWVSIFFSGNPCVALKVILLKFLCRFYPERATSLAFVLINELVEVSFILIAKFKLFMKCQ